MENGHLEVDFVPRRTEFSQQNGNRAMANEGDSSISHPGDLEVDAMPISDPHIWQIKNEEEATREYKSICGSLSAFHQSFRAVCMENERLHRENEYLRNQLWGIHEQLSCEKNGAAIKEDKKLIEQLRNRCQELLDEVHMLRNKGNGAVGRIGAGVAFSGPLQTESVTNAVRDVDYFRRVLDQNQSSDEPNEFVEQAKCEERPEQPQHKRGPSPEEFAVFLASQISVGDQTSQLLRSLGLTSVQISDITERNPKSPMELRIDGIKTALSSVSGDRTKALIQALRKCKLNSLADDVCREFNLDLPRFEDDASSAGVSRGKALSSPCQEETPQNDLERVVQPFLKDPKKVNSLTGDLSKDLEDFSDVQLRSLTSAFKHWECQCHSVLGVLNCWASAERQRTPCSSDDSRMESLAQALLSSQRSDVLQRLKKHIRNGVIGPTLPRKKLLREVSYSLRLELIELLGLKREGSRDWRGLAQEIGYGDKIQLWDQRKNPAELLWDAWKTTNRATVGKLYDWAIQNNRPEIAGKLEQDIDF